jgi:hypothetical protein
MVSRDEQMDGSFWNVRESVPPLRVCFGAVRNGAMKLARLPEGQRKSRLTEGITALCVFDHDGNVELRNWWLLRGLGRSAKKQNGRTDEDPNSKSQMIGTTHGMITPFHMPFARLDEATITPT